MTHRTTFCLFQKADAHQPFEMGDKRWTRNLSIEKFLVSTWQTNLFYMTKRTLDLQFKRPAFCFPLKEKLHGDHFICQELSASTAHSVWECHTKSSASQQSYITSCKDLGHFWLHSHHMRRLTLINKLINLGTIHWCVHLTGKHCARMWEVIAHAPWLYDFSIGALV